MRFLFLNNYHYLRGGAERIFFDEMNILRTNGHIVSSFSRAHSRNIPATFSSYFPIDIKTSSVEVSWNSLRTAKEVIWSAESKRALDKFLLCKQFDIAHAHNIYGRLTSSVLDLLRERSIPIVMTLHDYKLICPSYKLMFKGRICEDCRQERFYMALRNRCHKNSLVASAVYAFESYYNAWFQKYRQNVTFFIAPSLFLKTKLVDFGWRADQIEHVPNFLALADYEPQFAPGKYLLYLGRLSPEKGLLTVIHAFMKIRSRNIRLLIAGDGPMRNQLSRLATGDPRIHLTGHLSGYVLKETTRNALAVVIPSEWYENAPVSVLEALAFGKPVIGSRIGGIPEMVDDKVNGFLFDPRNVADLQEKIEMILSMPTKRIYEMGKAARQKVEREYNAEVHYEGLMDIYRRALDKS